MVEIRETWVCFREAKIEIQTLDDSEEKREPRGSCKRVRRYGGNIRQRSTQRRTTGKGNAETGTNESHRGPALTFIANIRSNGIG